MRTAVAAAAVAVVALGLTFAPAAGAHSGAGQAQLYVATARLEPHGTAWSLTVMVRDADSGAPQPGFAVEASGSGTSGARFGPVALSDPGNDGRYEGLVPVAPGEWAITLTAGEIPGGQRALPFTKTWNIALQSGQALDVTGGAQAPRPGSGGSGTPFVPLVVAPVLGAVGVVLLAVRLLRRRQPLTSGRRVAS